jgi:CubicO group peptidase (beta-lactamase class C family)
MTRPWRLMPLLIAAWTVTAVPLPAQAGDWSAMEQAVKRGINRRVYPGAVIVVGLRDTVLYARGFGRTSWGRSAPVPDPARTLWDLASLTKVVATASTAMMEVDAGTLELDAPVVRYLPEFTGAGKDQVTVRMLLDHTSGLRPTAPLYRQPSRAAALSTLFNEPLERAPGASSRYSDLNAILLGLVVEQVAATPLDQAARTEVFEPLGMTSTLFRVSPSDRKRTAPSRVEHGRPVAGEANDPNARRLGGVAGHAGLFSTGMDLARFAQAWLRDGQSLAGPWVSPATLQQFLRRSPHAGTRALGWDTPDTTRTSAFGAWAHADVVGHTGWTGTTLWLDPDANLFLVFLTNRAIAPSERRSLVRIREVRTEVSDAARQVVETLCLARHALAC